MISPADQLTALRIEARHRWGYAGPYRLGLVIGARGLDIANPYTHPRSRKVFDDGVAWGRAHPGGLQ